MRRAVTLAVLSIIAAGALFTPTGAALPDGLPVVSLEDALELAGVELPRNDNIGLILHADFPVGSPFASNIGDLTALTIDITPDGVRTLSAVPASAATAPGGEVEECTDPSFASVGKQWSTDDLPLEFAINHRSIPDYMSPWLTTRSIREAHQVWGLTNSKCENKDSIDFKFNYTGSAKKQIGYDSLNVTDFGDLKRAVALSYVWYSGQRIREVDLRMNSSYMWTNRHQVNDRYQVKNVAVHEIGHALGLDDLTQPHGSLTMFGVIGKGELKKQSLGKGDVKGAELIQP